MISPQAYAVAQKYLQGVPESGMMGALTNAINAAPDVPLTQLIAAHRLLQHAKQQKEAQQAGLMAQQGGLGSMPQQNQTVAQQVAGALSNVNQDLEREVMASASQPMRQDGLASLDSGALGDTFHAASGGIVAFSDNKDQPVHAGMPTAEEVEPSEESREKYRKVLNPLNWFKTLVNAPGYGLNAPAAPIAPPQTPPQAPSQTPPQAPPQTPPPPTSGTVPTAGGGVEKALADIGRQRKVLEQRQADELAAMGRELETNRPERTKPLDEYLQQAAELRAKATEGTKSPKERAEELKKSAEEAVRGRDTDRLLALAQGFFSMGAGRSQYALQNFAEGLGVATKELREVERDFRKAEQLRKDRIAVLEEAERQEKLGNATQAIQLHEKAATLEERFRERQLTWMGQLATATGHDLTRLQGQEATLFSRGIAAQQAAASREQMQALKYANPQIAATLEYKAAKTDDERKAVLARWQPLLASMKATPESLAFSSLTAGAPGKNKGFEYMGEVKSKE